MRTEVLVPPPPPPPPPPKVTSTHTPKHQTHCRCSGLSQNPEVHLPAVSPSGSTVPSHWSYEAQTDLEDEEGATFTPPLSHDSLPPSHLPSTSLQPSLPHTHISSISLPPFPIWSSIQVPIRPSLCPSLLTHLMNTGVLLPRISKPGYSQLLNYSARSRCTVHGWRLGVHFGGGWVHWRSHSVRVTRLKKSCGSEYDWTLGKEAASFRWIHPWNIPLGHVRQRFW